MNAAITKVRMTSGGGIIKLKNPLPDELEILVKYLKKGRRRNISSTAKSIGILETELMLYLKGEKLPSLPEMAMIYSFLVNYQRQKRIMRVVAQAAS